MLNELFPGPRPTGPADVQLRTTSSADNTTVTGILEMVEFNA